MTIRQRAENAVSAAGAPGRKHFIYRVVLKRGETREISLDLPLRTNE